VNVKIIPIEDNTFIFIALTYYIDLIASGNQPMLYYLPHLKLKMDIDDVPNSGQPMSAAKKPPAKQKPKVLPNELLAITDCAASHAEFVIVTEPDPHKNSMTYGKDCQVVAKYQITTLENKIILFDLTNLTVDQIRMLFQSVGITNYSSASKFQCWSLIARYIGYNKNLVEAGVNHRTDEDKKTSTILQLVNVVFGD
jgi:hypothetical protein